MAMKKSGDVVIFRFPQTDLSEGKLRPALLLCPMSVNYNDWLICMISSQLKHYTPDLDEIVTVRDDDFAQSGLVCSSLIRVARIAVIEEGVLIGKIGEVSEDRIRRIKKNLAEWIQR